MSFMTMSQSCREKAAAEKQIAIIEGKNGITLKTKNRGHRNGGGGGGGGAADAAVKTKPKCNNCGKYYNGVCNKPKTTAFTDRLKKSGTPNWNTKLDQKRKAVRRSTYSSKSK